MISPKRFSETSVGVMGKIIWCLIFQINLDLMPAVYGNRRVITSIDILDNESGDPVFKVPVNRNGELMINNKGKVMATDLPTSDPNNAGQLWNDSGTVKISAG